MKGQTENEYEFLYMTDSQIYYQDWANTLRKGLDKFPNAKFIFETRAILSTVATKSTIGWIILSTHRMIF